MSKIADNTRTIDLAQNVRLVTAFAALALVPMIVAHVIGAEVVNPLLDPISWYAFVPGGALMITIGGSLLAVLGQLLMVRMYRRRLVHGPVPAVAMIIFSVALVLVGICHTDPPQPGVTIADGSLAATVHRISAGMAFVALPVVGVALARSISAPVSRLPKALCRSAYGLAVLVGAFLSIHLPLAFVGSGIADFGLIERAGFVIMIGFLFLIAATIDRETTARTAVPATGSQAAAVAVADSNERRQTSDHGVGLKPSLVSASLESTTYGRVKM